MPSGSREILPAPEPFICSETPRMSCRLSPVFRTLPHAVARIAQATGDDGIEELPVLPRAGHATGRSFPPRRWNSGVESPGANPQRRAAIDTHPFAMVRAVNQRPIAGIPERFLPGQAEEQRALVGGGVGKISG